MFDTDLEQEEETEREELSLLDFIVFYFLLGLSILCTFISFIFLYYLFSFFL